MGFRPRLIVVLVATVTAMAMAMVAESSFRFEDASLELDTLRSHGVESCNGRVGDCINKAEEMMMDSEIHRRFLGPGQGYISYSALKSNNVPCDRRGQSYYNCNQQANANPYNRGCTFITKCARHTGS